MRTKTIEVACRPGTLIAESYTDGKEHDGIKVSLFLPNGDTIPCGAIRASETDGNVSIVALGEDGTETLLAEGWFGDEPQGLAIPFGFADAEPKEEEEK